ncbi:MAG: hypothetical protein R5N60_08430, partial [Cutibacterium granulosum]|nr:hypothetical protein [Cutibacterium granulosum]
KSGANGTMMSFGDSSQDELSHFFWLSFSIHTSSSSMTHVMSQDSDARDFDACFFELGICYPAILTDIKNVISG